MRKQIVIVATLCLVIGMAAGSAHSQVIQAKVPFNFIVSGKTLAAGEYTMITHAHQLKIEDAGGRVVAMVLVSDSGRSHQGKGEIIFHCYQERCFLAEVWPTTYGNGHELFTSRIELEAALEQPGKLFAVLGTEPRK